MYLKYYHAKTKSKRLRVAQPVHERDYIQVSVITRKKNYSISSTEGEIKRPGNEEFNMFGGKIIHRPPVLLSVLNISV